MKKISLFLALFLVLALAIPVSAGKGPGGPGGGGGGDIPDTGELYGDLYVVLRDVHGTPILDANGCIQPISATDGYVEILGDEPGEVLFTTTAYEGEPFALAYYTDESAEIEVACELTAEMLDWVQAVDFGRLNLGRAPEGVVAHAFDEAVNKLNAAVGLDLDPAGRIMYTLDNITWSTIDAPAENLALYIKMMTDGHWITTNTDPIVKGGKPADKGPSEGGPSTEPRPVLNCFDPETDDPTSLNTNLTNLGFINLCNADEDKDLAYDELILAASLLAAAADKGGEITLDKVVYINSIYGINQLGTHIADDGTSFYDFSLFGDDTDNDGAPNDVYDRRYVYQARGSAECVDDGPSYVWVLQPFGAPEDFTFGATCMDLLTYVDPFPEEYTDNAVRFLDMVEEYQYAEDADGNPISGFDFITNVRAFAQASDDALQVIEYIHNYKVPEDLYGFYTPEE